MSMDEEIQKAAEVLRSGGTLLYPTDTVWGIGCDATNAAAVRRVYALKEREESKSLIVLLDEDAKLNKYVREVPAVAWDLVELADSPLTIVYSGPCNLAENVISTEDNTVAIRVTKDEFCRRLIRKFGKPIVSTSANKSGDATPGNFREIKPEIVNGVDYIVNLRQSESMKFKPSAIMKVAPNGEVKIIRK
jgi:L-threonylcarbamoyladenylate synthase